MTDITYEGAGNDDPQRPIPLPAKLVPRDECQHPWSRVALIDVPNNPGMLTLQCHDCTAYLKVHGEPLIFQLH
jgi:hypothetical protein